MTAPVKTPRTRRCLAGAVVVALALPGCSRTQGSKVQSDNPVGRMTADRYVKTAIRRSPEGVIMLPSTRAERSYDRARLNEIAQELRQPAAGCFVRRAIDTIEATVKDDEPTFTGVPEGQIKLRVRIAPGGETLRAEVLETGFSDPEMEACLIEVLEAVRWPQNRSNMAQFVDIVYWASMGLLGEDRGPAMRREYRYQEALAARQGTRCFEGRVPKGTYKVAGLLLLDKNGRAVASRVSPEGLPEGVPGCLNAAFAKIQMPRLKDAFIRPFVPEVTFVMGDNGVVSFDDAQWLHLVTLEQRALREARKAALVDGEVAAEAGAPELGLGGPLPRGAMATTATAPEEVDAPERDPGPVRPLPEKVAPANEAGEDPGKGQKLDLLQR
ncbi:MAG: hypothetical protein KC636_20860 [Myxococcales bacterium]|nr:hypothetical protein [Myxococcales bacterium]